ncbi:MAG: PAS domain S-box protein, partial [Candidatus Cloacimonetes bacterium]|nr:PAS domain S-box protein [Candidatus Cloacimonadota bacterium]
MYDSLKILFVEDNETDVRLMVQMLKKEFETVSYRQVNDADALLRALEDERWDIIVTDYSMPEFSGEEVLEIHRSLGLNMPVILVSGAVGEEIAVEMMKAGANDYILKDNLPRLIPAITRELEDYRIRLERKRIQNELTESQHRYQTLVDMSPDGICMLDTRFITLLANPRKAVLFGYETPEEMVGLNALSMIAEGYREDLLTNMPNYLENGLIDCMEVEFLRKDGSKFWGELRCKVIKDDYGTPQSIVNVVTDISQRKAMEEALVESESRFRSAYENAPIGMELLALNGRIMRANKAFCDLIGYEESELNRMSFYDVTHPDDVSKNTQIVEDMIANRSDTVRFEKRYIRKDGDVICVSVSSTLIRGKQNQPLYFVSQVQDVTRQKQAEQEIISARDKAEESDRLKSALLANMSHELRTPMSGVLGFADIIIKTAVDPEIREMAGLIQISGKRLMTTLDSVMLLAQLESTDNVRDLNYTFVNLSRMLNNMADKLRSRANQKGLELKLEIEPEIYLSTEYHLLTQAINKVLDNALKFTESGSISISLDLEVSDTGNSVVIKVTDTGIGID